MYDLFFLCSFSTYLLLNAALIKINQWLKLNQIFPSQSMARTVEPNEHTTAVPVRGVHVKLTQVLGFVWSVLDL